MSDEPVVREFMVRAECGHIFRSFEEHIYKARYCPLCGSETVYKPRDEGWWTNLTLEEVRLAIRSLGVWSKKYNPEKGYEPIREEEVIHNVKVSTMSKLQASK